MTAMHGDGRHNDGDERHDNGNGQQGNRRHNDGNGWHDNCKTYCSCTPGQVDLQVFYFDLLEFFMEVPVLAFDT